MYVVRILGAWLLGLVAVVFIVLAWGIFVALMAWEMSDCSGLGWAISCSTSNSGLVRFALFALLAVAAAAWIMYRTIRRLAQWASESDDSRSPPFVAGVIVGVLTVAAAVAVAISVASEWGGG